MWQATATEHASVRSDMLAAMHFDRRLWGFTAGERS
jgi:hypothetical protein